MQDKNIFMWIGKNFKRKHYIQKGPSNIKVDLVFIIKNSGPFSFSNALHIPLLYSVASRPAFSSTSQLKFLSYSVEHHVWNR